MRQLLLVVTEVLEAPQRSSLIRTVDPTPKRVATDDGPGHFCAEKGVRPSHAR